MNGRGILVCLAACVACFTAGCSTKPPVEVQIISPRFTPESYQLTQQEVGSDVRRSLVLPDSKEIVATFQGSGLGYVRPELTLLRNKLDLGALASRSMAECLEHRKVAASAGFPADKSRPLLIIVNQDGHRSIVETSIEFAQAAKSSATFQLLSLASIGQAKGSRLIQMTDVLSDTSRLEIEANYRPQPFIPAPERKVDDPQPAETAPKHSAQ